MFAKNWPLPQSCALPIGLMPLFAFPSQLPLTSGKQSPT